MPGLCDFLYASAAMILPADQSSGNQRPEPSKSLGESQLELRFTTLQEPTTLNEMKVHIPKKQEPKPLKTVQLSIAQLAARTLRRLDNDIAYKQALHRGGKLLPEDKHVTELRMTDEAGKLIPAVVHKVTAAGCWRPDLFYAGGRACDLCGLFPYCLSKLKTVKDRTSQGADKNPGFFKDKAVKELGDDDDDIIVGIAVSAGNVAANKPPKTKLKLKAKSGIKLRLRNK